jgi:putative Mn2+ efflux pump MntP
MENRKNQKFSEKPIVRTLLTVLSILLLLAGLVSLFKENANYLSCILLIGLGSVYLWTEIQVIRNPNVLEEDENSISTVQLRNNELAFWWQRLVCFTIDFIICFMLSAVTALFLKVSPEATYILAFVIFIYFFLSETLMGTTIGKAIFGLKVIDTKNWTKPNLFQILIRTLCRFIPFEGLSFISAKPNGWHDSLSNTAVIKR